MGLVMEKCTVKQTEQRECLNQNDATNRIPKGKSESHPLKWHNDSGRTLLAVWGGAGVVRKRGRWGFRQ